MKQPITTCLIALSGKRGRGHYAIIDTRDAERARRHRWYMDRDGYAFAVIDTDGKRRMVGMHRFINETPGGLLTDHVNRIKLDNRRSNLRSVTNSQNQANRLPMAGTSRYKGVHWDQGRWVAAIKVHKAIKVLGRYRTERDAAAAYDRAAVAAWGDHALLNLPGTSAH